MPHRGGQRVSLYSLANTVIVHPYAVFVQWSDSYTYCLVQQKGVPYFHEKDPVFTKQVVLVLLVDMVRRSDL